MVDGIPESDIGFLNDVRGIFPISNDAEGGVDGLMARHVHQLAEGFWVVPLRQFDQDANWFGIHGVGLHLKIRRGGEKG